MAARPRDNNSNENSRIYKMAKKLTLHGLTCREIYDSIKGIDEEQLEIIVDKFRDNKTALELAVQDNNIEVVRCLLKLGADTDKRYNRKTYTCIHVATYNNNFDMVKLLLERGADLTLTTEHYGSNFTTLYTACEKGFTNIALLLLEDEQGREIINNSPQDQTPYITPLSIAILHGHKALVEALKGLGAIISEEKYTQDEFQKLLLAECTSRSLNNVKMLLDDFDYIKTELQSDIPGLDVNYVTDDDYSPLFNASRALKNLEIIEYLWSKGAVLADGELETLEDYYKANGKTIPQAYRQYIEPVQTPLRRSVYNENNTSLRNGRNTRKGRKGRKTRKSRKATQV